MNLEDNREKELRELDEKIEKIKKDEGDLELRDVYVEKAEYYLQKNNTEKSVETYLLAIEKTAGIAKKLEYYLVILHTYFKQRDLVKFSEYLTTCKKLNEEGGDWEKKNKIMVYDGIWHILKRDLQGAAEIFLSCVNTFNAPEIIDFRQLVFYGVVLGMTSLHRKDIQKKILDNPEIVSVLREDPLLENFLSALHNRKYGEYFSTLVRMVEERINKDDFLKQHSAYYVRMARLVVYRQYLESYKTVRLDKMAKDFGISADFLDRELFRFISSRRLNCQIDRVRGLVESSKADCRVTLFKDLLRSGDNLLEQMHKVARTALF